MVAGQYERAVQGFSRVLDPPHSSIATAQWLLKYVVVVDSFQLCHSNHVRILFVGLWNHVPKENKSCFYFLIMCYFFLNGNFPFKCYRHQPSYWAESCWRLPSLLVGADNGPFRFQWCSGLWGAGYYVHGAGWWRLPAQDNDTNVSNYCRN